MDQVCAGFKIIFKARQRLHTLIDMKTFWLFIFQNPPGKNVNLWAISGLKPQVSVSAGFIFRITSKPVI
jgi:hypothetical protein